MSDWYCCEPVWRHPSCLIDSTYHRIVVTTKREFYIPGINWICDRHEHNMTGISMAELQRERHARRLT